MAISSGLTLVFGVLRVINFAHGAMYMLGAFLAYSVVRWFASIPGINFWLALIIAPILVAIIAGIIEFVFLRRIYVREHLYQLLLTSALVYIISDIAKISWGTMPVNVPKPAVISGSLMLWGATIPGTQIFLTALSALVGILLWLFLYKTKYGNLIRAAAADAEMTQALGIDCSKLYMAVFMMGCWLAAVGGVGSTTILKPIVGMDADVILLCFIVIVVGGMGSLVGALIGSLLIGQVESIGILVVPRLPVVLVFSLMTVVLIARPWGLFGIKQR